MNDGGGGGEGGTALVAFGQHCRKFQNCCLSNTIHEGEDDQRRKAVSQLKLGHSCLQQPEVTEFEG